MVFMAITLLRGWHGRRRYPQDRDCWQRISATVYRRTTLLNNILDPQPTPIRWLLLDVKRSAWPILFIDKLSLKWDSRHVFTENDILSEVCPSGRWRRQRDR
jgi:hypothetical protein